MNSCTRHNFSSNRNPSQEKKISEFILPLLLKLHPLMQRSYLREKFNTSEWPIGSDQGAASLTGPSFFLFFFLH